MSIGASARLREDLKLLRLSRLSSGAKTRRRKPLAPQQRIALSNGAFRHGIIPRQTRALNLRGTWPPRSAHFFQKTLRLCQGLTARVICVKYSPLEFPFDATETSSRGSLSNSSRQCWRTIVCGARTRTPRKSVILNLKKSAESDTKTQSPRGGFPNCKRGRAASGTP